MKDHDEDGEKTNAKAPKRAKDLKTTPKDPRQAIVEALLELAGEREWDDITISDVATRANLSLVDLSRLFSVERRGSAGLLPPDRQDRP